MVNGMVVHQQTSRENRAVASLSLPGEQDKNISSIFPHFPVVSLNFPQIFFIFLIFWPSGWAARPSREGPGYAPERKNKQKYKT